MAEGTISLADAAGMTVGDVMIRRPKTLPADALVADVRQLFERPSVRTVLFADGERFAGAIEREGLPDDAPDDAPARKYADTEPATATAGLPMLDAIKLIEARGEPRLIVLDDDGETLVGLVCGNTTATGFCVR